MCYVADYVADPDRKHVRVTKDWHKASHNVSKGLKPSLARIWTPSGYYPTQQALTVFWAGNRGIQQALTVFWVPRVRYLRQQVSMLSGSLAPFWGAGTTARCFLSVTRVLSGLKKRLLLRSKHYCKAFGPCFMGLSESIKQGVTRILARCLLGLIPRLFPSQL